MLIIKQLHLKNFISYDDQTISFPMGVITIVGENGAGKTAILDGITYALFKEHSRGKDENLIRRQFRNAEVKLRFMTRGKNYEVIWKLSRKRSATGHLRNIDDNYPMVRPESGERTIVPEIEKLLGLDKNLFMNAIYVKQGEIAKLIDARPSERKKLIGEILGIEALEKIWETMREPLSNLENELKVLKRDVEQLSIYGQELEEKKEDLLQACIECRKKREDLARINEKLRSLEKEVRELDNKAKRYEEIKEEINSLSTQKQEKEFNLQKLESEITELENVLSILREYGPYYEDIMEKRSKLRSLKEKWNKLKEEINKKSDLEKEKTRVEERIRGLENDINEKLRSFEEITGTKIGFDDIDRLSWFYEERRREIVEETAEINKEMMERINEKRKYARIGSLSAILGAISVITLVFLAGLSALSIISTLGIISLIVFILGKLSKKRKDLENEIELLKQELRGLEFREWKLDEFNISEVIKSYEKLKRYEEEIIRLEEEISILHNLKSQQNSLEQEIAAIESELDRLKQYEDKYNWAQEVLKRKGLESSQELEKRLKEFRNQKLTIDNKRKELEKKIDELRKELEKLQYDREIHQKKRKEFEILQEERNRIHGEARELEGRIKELSRQIVDLRNEIKRLESAKEKYEKLERFFNSLKKIRDLFHKDGPLQNAIRGDAAMRIEDNARSFLQEFSLPFFDLRVDRDFNILVYGRDGVQTLDSLSGGEKVALALVIRLAIAAALTGEALELMIMDEPTIHLDSDRRRELVNLLKNFRGGSRMISQLIVVSHDRELEEAADVVYEVSRKGGVSKIRRLTETEQS